jgi:hypothetical protein
VRRVFVLLVFGGLVVLLLLLRMQQVAIPARWNPFAPLDLRQPPNLLTSFKQARAARDPILCGGTVEASGMVRAAPVPDRIFDDECSIENAFAVTGVDGVRAPRLVASCRLTVALSLWLLHVVQPEAQQILGTRVVRLEHLGSYACGNAYHRREGPRSRHATADAIDIAAFVLADGRRVPVSDWRAGTLAARFLHAVRDGACSFATVLGPDYNEVHADHLHIEVGGWTVCR